MTQSGQRRVPINRRVPEGMKGVFANHFVVQHTNREFILSFFQLMPLMLIDPTPEQIAEVQSVPAHAVARVVVTPEALRELIDVLERNYSKFETARRDAMEEE